MPPRGALGSVRKRAGVPSDSLFSRRGRTEPPLSSARSCSHRAPSRTPHPEAQPHPAQCPEPPALGRATEHGRPASAGCLLFGTEPQPDVKGQRKRMRVPRC